ncbi:MAG: hypothetical protein QOK48_1601, partial [Blastocatellia bacterium]|nr:hypothetical protein [Blastocatellia bacterium]
MPRKKPSPKQAVHQPRRMKYFALPIVALAATITFGAVSGRWRSWPVLSSLVSSPAAPPVPTIPPPANPSKEYIYA